MNMRYTALGLAALLVASLGVSYYFYNEAQTAKNPERSAQEESKKLVAAVGRLMVLPDETPVIATVADPEKLAGQPFFQEAKKGDKVLLYNNAKTAILYDPVADRIVEVAPLNTGTASPAPTP